MDLPQIVIPTPLYNAILCSLIVMASWHALSLANGAWKRIKARGSRMGQREDR